VPSRIIALEDIPKNAAGKISRVNFYNQIKPFLKQEYSLSANEIEEKMLQAWKDILKEDDIGTKDNFFEIGGDSLKVQELLHRLSKQNLQISPKQFLNNPTIKDLAKSIKNNKNLI
jgi:aryl carrier-like protein